MKLYFLYLNIMFKIENLHFTFSVKKQYHWLQAPIQLFGVEGRYAHALYSAASKQKKLDVVEGDLKKVKVVHHLFKSLMLM